MLLQTRIIPCLLLLDGGLVKTVKFRRPKYVGDPINAVRIFNDKEVDELMLVDISATKNKRAPDFPLLERICKESFMPMCYGGGISDLDTVRKLIWLGFEKVCLNSAFLSNPEFVRSVVDTCGSQSVVVSIDVKSGLLGRKRAYDHVKGKALESDPEELAQRAVKLGAGEILLNVVERDGQLNGYDIDILKKVTSVVPIPVIALGGAGSINDLVRAVNEGGASAVAAGSFFVFYGKERAVLISYPSKQDLHEAFTNKAVPTGSSR